MYTDNLYNYWAEYYRDVLSLPDWEMRAQSRLSEEEKMLRVIKQKMSLIPFSSMHPSSEKMRVLIVGGGTGGELLAFWRQGYDTWMIEPDLRALSLSRERARLSKIPENHIVQGVAENLPFEDDSFDFVWSFTVFEHVNNYENALKEVTRVLKKDAWACLVFPDYRCIYEQHYKLYLPLFLPKWINSCILRFRKRDPYFYNKHTNNINARKFLKIARELPLTVLREHTPWSDFFI